MGDDDDDGSGSGVGEVLRRFCDRRKRISVRQGGNGSESEYVYQVRLRDRRRRGDLVDALRGVQGVGEVALVLRDELQEM